MHLGRGPIEAPDHAIEGFYDALLACLRDPPYRSGHWQLLNAAPAWEGNGSHDAFLVYAWTGADDEQRLVAVNYADHHSQAYVVVPWAAMRGRQWRLQDQLGPAVYDRDGDELVGRGLFLDLPPWGHHAFAITRA